MDGSCSLQIARELPPQSTSEVSNHQDDSQVYKLLQDVVTPMNAIITILNNRLNRLEIDNKCLKEQGDIIQSENASIMQHCQTTDLKIKNIEMAQTNLKKAIIKQHAHLARNREEATSKSLVICGLSETEFLTYGEDKATTDNDKVQLILKAMGKEDVDVVCFKRIGKQDQSDEKRPKFLLLQFADRKKRNEIRSAAHKLRQIEKLSGLRIKAVLSKEEKEEYTRIFKIKEQLSKDHPESKLEFTKRTLFMDGQPIYTFRLFSDTGLNGMIDSET